MLQRWTIDTTDDRDGQGNGTYVVDGVASTSENDMAFTLYDVNGHALGSFPPANIIDKSFEDYDG